MVTATRNLTQFIRCIQTPPQEIMEGLGNISKEVSLDLIRAKQGNGYGSLWESKASHWAKTLPRAEQQTIRRKRKATGSSKQWPKSLLDIKLLQMPVNLHSRKMAGDAETDEDIDASYSVYWRHDEDSVNAR